MPGIVEAVENLVRNFSTEELSKFFLLKNKNFTTHHPLKRLYVYERDRFKEIYELGNVKLNDNKELFVFAIKTEGELTERSNKRAQYDLAKTLLKEHHAPCGIFVFFDNSRNFRFSLVYAVFSGTRATFSHYRRYTYYVAADKPYRTFIKALTEAKFDTLEDIILAFSTQPLTKEFYTEIQNWYAWALKYAKFPGGSKEENLIRLLTRLIFVWFLKERKLIPEQIFDPNFLRNVVKDFGKTDHYYNAILQNLFFATLNRYPDDRKFTQNGDFFINRQEFGIKTLYRYKEYLLIEEQDFIKIFENVPFINGGLFECLDENGNYIDGFSRRADKRAKLLDFLFFGEEQQVDLSDFYGKKRKARVRGLINILKDYNFTADESSPIDVEVSLDPELLGHIFENLLASYNPETQTTARKATGSYYTPKEIVDFMVEESLLEYFKTKTNIDEQRLRSLLSYAEEPIELSDEERKLLIHSIDTLKVIDPAVGSGAFPMGVVHKLVHILRKIDPDNKLWHELQLSKTLHEVEEVLKIKNKSERERLLKEVNDNFDETLNYPDYARKLYVIENVIYGVDIQSIAIQICKLRFFLSLLIDQKIDRTKPNFGIKPLPHLETKFVSANTLIGLERPAQSVRLSQLELESRELNDLKNELKKLHKKHFTIKTRNEKKNLANRAKQIREKIKEILVKSGWKNESAEKIASFDIFSQTATADWFDPEWMFGVEDGFDIVIGNPPYVRQEKIKPLKPILNAQNYETYSSTADLYVYFYEKGYQLLKSEGLLCFISSNKWMRAKYGEKLRKFLREKTQLLKIIDFGGYSVFQQTVDTCIILWSKQIPSSDWMTLFVNVPSTIESHQKAIEFIQYNLNPIEQKKLSDQVYVLSDDRVLKLKEKIERIGKPLKDWDVKIYRGILTGYNEAFIIDNEKREIILTNCRTEEERKLTESLIKPVLRGRDIGRYCYKWAGLWIIIIPAGWTNKHRKGQDAERFFKSVLPSLYDYLYSFIDNEVRGRRKGLLYRDDQGDYWWELRPCDYYSEFEKEKIVWQRVTQRFSFCYVPSNLYILDSMAFLTVDTKEKHLTIKFLLGVLNSKVSDFYIKTYIHQYANTGFLLSNQYVEKVIIPSIVSYDKSIANKIESLVSQILDIKKQDCSADTSRLESQIDQLVYELYDLTPEEIAIIEENSNKKN